MLIFQNPVSAFNPVFRVGDVFLRTLRLHGVGRSEARERARAGMREVVLSPDLLERYPHELSGGQAQRVAIALAVALRSEVLLADEPTSALDVTVQAEILKLFDELVRSENRSVLFITHSMGVVREVADRVAVMYAGVVVEEAPTADLFAHPKHPYTVGLLDCVPRLTGQEVARGIPGTLPDYTAPPPGCRFHPRCPHAMPVCREARPPAFPVAGTRHRVACWLYEEDGDHQSEEGQR